MTDEVRHLAEEIIRDDNAPYAGPDMTVTRQLWAASSAPTLARHLLALLERTRLTAGERESVEGIRQFITNHPIAVKQLLAIIDRTTQPEPSGGWQDIASAPKDGTPVLVVIPFSPVSVTVGAYDDAPTKPHWASWRYNGDDGPCDIPPTHWMPLPSAPLPNSGGGE